MKYGRQTFRFESDEELQNRLIEMRIKEEGEAMKVQGIAEGRAVGIAEGKAEGRAVGKAEGIAVGEARNKVEMLKSYRKYLKSTGFSEETQEMLYNGFVAVLD